MNPKISIIFPSYNGEKQLTRNFESIKNLSNLDDIELVIIDNNSHDSTIEIIKSYEGVLNINLIIQKQNLGFAKACNIGVSNAKSEFVFITNQDVIFPQDFFHQLLILYNKLKKKDEIVLSPAFIFEDGNIHYFGAHNQLFGFSYTPKMGKKLPTEKIIKKTQRFSGGCVFMKKKLFLDMGGFDSIFFMYYEDTDLSLRILRCGFLIYTTNITYLIHQKHSWKLSDFQYYLFERNRYLFFLKNIDNFRKLIPFFIILEFVMIIQSILSKHFRLRIRIYYELLTHKKFLKKIRNESRQEVKLWSYQKLYRSLDPVLLGDFRNVKLLRRLLHLLNYIFKLI